MEKPGLEPPPPAFPNKGLIEAGPAPSHTEPRDDGASVGAEESWPSGLHKAGWQQLLQSPPHVPSSCRLGVPVLRQAGGLQLGAE